MCAQITHMDSPIVEPLQEELYASQGVPVLYGYIRAIGSDAELNAQMDALRQAGVPDNCIFAEQVSRTCEDFVEYAHMLRLLQEDDVVVLPSLDRLGIGYDEIISQWQILTYVKKVRVVVLDIPALDMRKVDDPYTQDLLAKVTLHFLAYAATREREGIRQRQHEGILAAKDRGVRFGRPPKPIPPQFETLLAQWKNREISSRKAAQQLGVAQETFLRWARKKG